jgi:hypothetical protein
VTAGGKQNFTIEDQASFSQSTNVTLSSQMNSSSTYRIIAALPKE